MKKIIDRAKSKIRFNPLVQKTRRLFYSPFAATDLPFILTHLDSHSPLNDQIYWIEQLLNWINLSGELPSDTEATKSSIQIVRIKFVLHLLNRNPVWKSKLSQALRLLMRESSSLELFSQTGLHQEFGFWGEAADRMVKKFLPSPPDGTNIAELFSRIFSSEDDARWIEEMTPELLLQVGELFYFEVDTPEGVFARTRSDMKDAIVVLSTTIGGVGLSRDVLRSKTVAPHDSPFYSLSFHVNSLVVELDRVQDNIHLVEFINPCLQEIQRCREGIRHIFRSLEYKGVSVAVVYRLDQLQFALNRLETLLHLILLRRDRDSLGIIGHFIAELIREQSQNRGLRSLFKSNLRLLSKKIVERTGVTGEHYITTSRSEYFEMLRAALGGGALTVLTTLLKSWISSLKLPFFWDFVGTGTNYALSFVSIQLCGFTLATKQPSATAAHLAGKLENINTHAKVQDFVEEFKRISRSQFAAAVGNIGMAIPASGLVYLFVSFLFQREIFSEEYATYTLDSLNPLGSFTIFYAALTGVILWASGIFGGWVENWIVYRRIPDAVALHRGLRARLGPTRAEKLGAWLSHNAAGLGSNTCLGFLLAGVPVFSRFFGIGLDVRHVTLSTCALTLSTFSLWGHSLDWQKVGFASAGIFCIGLLNFGVSFYLALMVAARAKSLERSTILFLAREVFKSFVKKPRGFFIP